MAPWDPSVENKNLRVCIRLRLHPDHLVRLHCPQMFKGVFQAQTLTWCCRSCGGPTSTDHTQPWAHTLPARAPPHRAAPPKPPLSNKPSGGVPGPVVPLLPQKSKSCRPSAVKESLPAAVPRCPPGPGPPDPVQTRSRPGPRVFVLLLFGPPANGLTLA